MPFKSNILSQPGKSERLILSEQIAKVATTMDKFLEATQQFQDYKTDVFADLDRQIEAKKSELTDVTQKINTEEEETRIATKQRIQEFRREAAIQILSEFDEEAISSEELSNMRDELDELKQNQEDEINEAVDKIKTEYEKAKHTALNNMELTHKATIARLEASAEQKEKEVNVLQQTIDDLKHELREQRELTKSVAGSLKQGAITLNTGKQ